MAFQKKAEVPAQIMTYVLASILFVLIMIFGYNTVTSMRTSAEAVSVVNFKSQIESDIHKMAMESGRTIRTYSYASPGNFREVCFVNSKYIEDKDKITEGDCANKELVVNSVEQGVPNNMFFFPGIMSYDIGTIETDYGCICLPVKSGKVNVRFQGKGDRAKILPVAESN